MMSHHVRYTRAGYSGTQEKDSQCIVPIVRGFELGSTGRGFLLSSGVSDGKRSNHKCLPYSALRRIGVPELREYAVRECNRAGPIPPEGCDVNGLSANRPYDGEL
jgi:hypothetical protein